MLGALSVAVHAWDLLKVTIIFITSTTIVWPQINIRVGTQLHPSTENWIKDLLSMSPPIRTSFILSQSIPSGSFHKPLILLRGQTDGKPQSQETNQSDHMDHSSVQFSSVTQLCLTLCDPMTHSTPGLPVHHQLPEFTQTHVH